MHRISRVLALAATAFMLAPSTMVFAGDHGSHPPMGDPLSVTCANKPLDQQFNCLRPGYVMLVSDLHGLSRNIATGSGSPSIRGYRANGTPIYWN